MSGEIDTGQLQRYLLGQLGPADRESVTERLSQDESYFETAEAVEAELRDAFVRRELSPRDREDFELHLLRTQRQKDETELAVCLAELLDSKRVDSKQVDSKPAAQFPRIPKAAWWAAAAAAMLLMLAWQNRSLHHQLDIARALPTRLTPQVAPPQVGPSIASLYLPEMTVRGSESPPELVLSAATQLVHLEIEFGPHGLLQADLENTSGARIWMQTLPPHTGSPTPIWISADVLSPGAYTLRIHGSDGGGFDRGGSDGGGSAGQNDTAYRFRVSRSGSQSPSRQSPSRQSPSSRKPAQ